MTSPLISNTDILCFRLIVEPVSKTYYHSAHCYTVIIIIMLPWPFLFNSDDWVD